VAQKLHACTDPPQDDRPNNRVHDIVDLLLVKRSFFPEGCDLSRVRTAGEAVFAARQQELAAVGMTPRGWPPAVVAYEHWPAPYTALATQAGLADTLEAAVAELNAWVVHINRS
jgi:hypothetical protein